MADEAPNDPVPSETGVPAAAPDAGEGAGQFERYALIAALTLVVLCLLVWDRWHGGSPAPGGQAPRSDRTLHVEMGGDDPPAPRSQPPRPPDPQVSSDLPAVRPTAPRPAIPPPPPQRTYTVKSGDTLSEIARRELGTSSRAQEIADLNALADPSKVKLGQVLKLPPK